MSSKVPGRNRSLKTQRAATWKAFSRYIRMRDSIRTTGTISQCICYFCGRPLETFNSTTCAQAGHVISRTYSKALYNAGVVYASCQNCPTSDTLVLSNDLEWKPIGDMRVGDIIMGIDEYKTEGNSQRRVRDAIILSKMEVVRDAYRVEMSDGTYVDCTKDHKFLMPQHRSMRRSNRNYEWKELGNIRFHGKTINPIKKLNYPDYSHIIMRVISPELCVTNNSYSAGYLAGFMDADGSLTATYKKQFMASFTQSTKHPHLIDGIEKHLRLLDIPYSVDLSYQHNGSFGENQHPMAHIRLNGGYYKTLEGLCKIKPEKAKGFSFDRMGAPWRGKEFVSIENIYPIGKREISIVSTSCGTYNTNGYFSHNCNGYKEGNHVAGFLHMCEDMGFEKASRVAVAAMQDGAHTFEELEDIEDGCLSAIEIMENYYAENSSII